MLGVCLSAQIRVDELKLIGKSTVEEKALTFALGPASRSESQSMEEPINRQH
jgi:hypothetical protein